jgi:hypothetical protein
MFHQPSSGLHQPLLQTRQRPVLDPSGQSADAAWYGSSSLSASRTWFERKRGQERRVIFTCRSPNVKPNPQTSLETILVENWLRKPAA